MAETALKKSQENGPEAEAQGGETRGVTATPAVDILEREEDLILHADMPGVAPGDVDVRFENGELTVHGRRSPGHTGDTYFAGRDEVTNFFRSFRVSEQIAVDQIEAGMKNGVLTLRLPKIEAVKPRKIAVKG